MMPYNYGQYSPVFVERQHVEVGDVVGVSEFQPTLALDFINEVADVLTHKLTLVTTDRQTNNHVTTKADNKSQPRPKQ